MKPSEAQNLYEILEIDKRATAVEIDNAFRKQAFVWHPDKHIDDYANADAEFKVLMNAYCILSDPTKRRDYDRYHFKRNVHPNYGKYRDERLTKYRAKQRALVNKMLTKTDRSCKWYQKLSRCSFYAMVVSAGLLLYVIIRQNQSVEHDFNRFLFCIPLVSFNGFLIGYVIAKKEIAEKKKKIRGLVIKLYSLVDEL
jgi:hypothetical protein